MKQYIKIDLYGQFDNDTKHAYTYPSKILNQYSFTEETVWTKSISDPRALHGNVCKTNTDCYVIWANEYGNYFSYITRNSRDSRGGMAMVTFFLERNHICDGRDIYSTLKRLSNRLIVNTDYDSIAVEEEIKDIIIYNSSKCIPVSVNKKSDTSEPTYGYRTYSDENELIDIFTFIAQNTYVNYDKIILAQTCNVKDNVLISKIDTPISKYYNIYGSSDVQANCNYVKEQDSFKIIYNKQGFDDAIISCHPPYKNCEYFKIKGASIILSNIENVNLTFTKTWYFDIRKAKDNSCIDENLIELSINGRIPEKSNRKFIRFTEEELKTFSEVNITAVGEHYHQYIGEVDLSKTNSIIYIKMESKVSKIRVQFNFANSISSSPVFMQMDETSKEFKELTQYDRFCGYRARLDFNNVYQVDIPKNPKRIRDYNYDRFLSLWWIKLLLIILIVAIVVAFGLLIFLYWSDIVGFINQFMKAL